MPATRQSRSRRYDQDVHQALVAGHTPAQVAAQLALSIEEVHAAQKRVQAAKGRLPPDEEARQRILLMLRIVAEQSMQAWQRSVREGEESTTVSTDNKDGKKAQRTTHRQAGDPRFLDRATRAMAQEARLRRLDKPLPDNPPQGEVAAPIETAGEPQSKGLEDYHALLQRRMQHPRYQELVDLVLEIDTGMTKPQCTYEWFNNPNYQNPTSRKITGDEGESAGNDGESTTQAGDALGLVIGGPYGANGIGLCGPHYFPVVYAPLVSCQNKPRPTTHHTPSGSSL